MTPAEPRPRSDGFTEDPPDWPTLDEVVRGLTGAVYFVLILLSVVLHVPERWTAPAFGPLERFVLGPPPRS